MTLGEIARRVGKLATDNSPTILTVIGVTGTLTTAYLTGKASFRAAEIISDEEWEFGKSKNRQQIIKERFHLVWRLYVPAASTATLTVAAIICANRIGTRRAAAMAAAYALSEKAFVEYREKVVEKIGENKSNKIRDELAQDRVTAKPVGTSEVVITGGGDVLCFDAFTGRYFKSDVEKLKKAQNDLNHRVLNDYYASLTDFYNLIGMSPTSYSDEVGWNSDKMLELEFSATMAEDGRPCISVNFAVAPIRNFYRVN